MVVTNPNLPATSSASAAARHWPSTRTTYGARRIAACPDILPQAPPIRIMIASIGTEILPIPITILPVPVEVLCIMPLVLPVMAQVLFVLLEARRITGAPILPEIPSVLIDLVLVLAHVPLILVDVPLIV